MARCTAPADISGRAPSKGTAPALSWAGVTYPALPTAWSVVSRRSSTVSLLKASGAMHPVQVRLDALSAWLAWVAWDASRA